jgi:sterol desaturase/sphingolipid hydroxylase (fatty acid hydroxylase superfamily)
MRRLLTFGLFPVSFALAQSVAWLATVRGWSHPVTLAGVSASVAVLVALFERLHPAHDEWNRSRQDVGVDALHTTISMIFLPPLLEISVLAGLLALAQWLAESIGSAGIAGLWPRGWPLIAQLGLALLVSQFIEYWVHRLMHERPLLWRLHATHHSPSRLYWLNAGRFHPIDTALSFTLGLAPLTLLGLPTEVLLHHTVWVAVHGMFQH